MKEKACSRFHAPETEISLDHAYCDCASDSSSPAPHAPTAAASTATASDAAADDDFGYSVAISGDTAIVGAYGDDDGASTTTVHSHNRRQRLPSENSPSQTTATIFL